MFLEIGKYTVLDVVKEVDFGFYLDGGPFGEILLPNNEIMVGVKVEVEGEIEVFIYHDNENRLIATTRTPLARADSFSYLKCKDVNKVGAFLDWGLMKQLFVPFREQIQRMEINKSYVVYVYEDEETERLVASARTNRFVSKMPPEDLKVGDHVPILISKRTDLGYKAIVSDDFLGLIYESDVFKPLSVGQRTMAYIKMIREDGKIDLSLRKEGFSGVQDAAGIILNKLENAADYTLLLTDKSSPDDIKSQLKMSKKTFKKAVGTLYKKGLITLESDKIVLKTVD